MPNYEEYFVAFLDILGFKNLLKEMKCNEIYSIFNVLHKKTSGTRTQNGVEIKAYKEIKHVILSDSVIVYIKKDIEDAFATLINICDQLQFSLANRDKPILLRGAISIGVLFSDSENDFIYGNGLTTAYLLENNLAKYPRIIFTGNVLEEGLKNTKYMIAYMQGIMKPYEEDDDSLYYINYLFPEFCNSNNLIRYYDGLINLCKEQLNKGIETNLRDKYIWLKRKISKAIKIRSDIAEYYKKLEEERNNQEIIEYNERSRIYPQQLDIKIEIKSKSNIKNKDV